jgi:hypothetical protein
MKFWKEENIGVFCVGFEIAHKGLFDIFLNRVQRTKQSIGRVRQSLEEFPAPHMAQSIANLGCGSTWHSGSHFLSTGHELLFNTFGRKKERGSI